MQHPRVMLAAPASGSGKTLITCGLLQALVNRNIKTASFKCGPDYIDPMFHTKVIGTPSRNLDTFFASADTVRYLFGRQADKAEVSVVEGVMGINDGMGGVSEQASSWELADVTDGPVILVVNTKGMSLSVIPLIKGFLEFCPQKGASGSFDSHIRGVVLNQTSPSVYPGLKKEIERALPVRVLGYVPRVEDCVIESRHLGLVTPDEIDGIRLKLQKLAEIVEKTVDIGGILELAGTAPEIDCSIPETIRNMAFPDDNTEGCKSVYNVMNIEHCQKNNVLLQSGKIGCCAENDSMSAAENRRPRIAVARDEAFCFYYEDNLELLQALGADLVFFSTLHDQTLPENVQGMILGGGYPELYAAQLSGNQSMLASIRKAVCFGLPYLAECGGFMYLHDTMEDMDGRIWPMAGVIHGHVRRTERLTRFGYITLTANEPQIFGEAGCSIRGHEFHYFDSSCNGEAFHACKPSGKRKWECMVAGENFAAGFPHLYYYSNPEFAMRFLRQCRTYSRRNFGTLL